MLTLRPFTSNLKNSISLEQNPAGKLILPAPGFWPAETPIALLNANEVVGQIEQQNGEYHLQLTQAVIITELPNHQKINIKTTSELQLLGKLNLDELKIDAPQYQMKNVVLHAKKTVLKGHGKLCNAQFYCVALAIQGEMTADESTRIICNELLQKAAKLTMTASQSDRKKTNLSIKSLWQQDAKSEFFSTNATIQSKDKAHLFGLNTVLNTHWRGNGIVVEGQFHGTQVIFELNEFFNLGLCELKFSEMYCESRLQDSKKAQWVLQGHNKWFAKKLFLESESDVKDCIIKTNSLLEFGKRTYENTQIVSDFVLTDKESRITLKQTELTSTNEVLAGELISQNSFQKTDHLLSFNKLHVEEQSQLKAMNALLKGETTLQESAVEFEALQVTGQQNAKNATLKTGQFIQSAQSTLQAEHLLLQATIATLEGTVAAAENSLIAVDLLKTAVGAHVNFTDSNLLSTRVVYNQGEIHCANPQAGQHGITANTLLSEGILEANAVKVEVRKLALSKWSHTHLQKLNMQTQHAAFAGDTTLQDVHHQSETMTLEGRVRIDDSQLNASVSIELQPNSFLTGTTLLLTAPLVLNSADIALKKLHVTGDWFLNKGLIEATLCADFQVQQGAMNLFGKIQSPTLSITSNLLILNLGGKIVGQNQLTYNAIAEVSLLGRETSAQVVSQTLVRINTEKITPFSIPCDKKILDIAMITKSEELDFPIPNRAALCYETVNETQKVNTSEKISKMTCGVALGILPMLIAFKVEPDNLNPKFALAIASSIVALTKMFTNKMEQGLIKLEAQHIHSYDLLLPIMMAYNCYFIIATLSSNNPLGNVGFVMNTLISFLATASVTPEFNTPSFKL